MTVIVVLSGIAEVVLRSLPARSSIKAFCLIRRMRVPVEVGVTGTLKTPGEVSLTVPMLMAAVPPFSKSAAVTVAALISSLKVTV